MKNINKVFNTITISLVVLIGIGMCGTFLSDYLISINWFGDYSDNTRGMDGRFNHWGARHYWYNWGVFFLFVTALARCIVKVVDILEE